MNPYLEPPGFLGTGASLLADLTLLAYLLLIIPAMLAGLVFARRKLHRPHHKWTMTGITVVNWLLIVLLMLAAYRFDVAPNIGAQPNNTRYLLPALHALFGLPAQLLATFVVLRMFLEDAQVARAKARGETVLSKYWFKRAKPVMWLTLALWLITAALGVISYLTRYNIVPAYALDINAAEPVSTQELLAPLDTPEVSAPLATEEAQAGAEPSPLPPIETEESAPGVSEPIDTPEIVFDTPTRQATRTPVPPVETKAAEPAATEELASATPTSRPSATRRPSRTPAPPAVTEEIG